MRERERERECERLSERKRERKREREKERGRLEADLIAREVETHFTRQNITSNRQHFESPQQIIFTGDRKDI